LVDKKLPHGTSCSLMIDKKQKRFVYDRQNDRFFDLDTPQGFQLSRGRCLGSAQGQASVLSSLPDEAYRAISDELDRMGRTGSADSQQSVSDDDKHEVRTPRMCNISLSGPHPLVLFVMSLRILADSFSRGFGDPIFFG
jgi:hypothetical protein